MQHMYGNACKEVVNLSGAIQIYMHFFKKTMIFLFNE